MHDMILPWLYASNRLGACNPLLRIEFNEHIDVGRGGRFALRNASENRRMAHPRRTMLSLMKRQDRTSGGERRNFFARRAGERTGNQIGGNDLLIAAQSISLRLTC